jgi:hypothetical protein
LLVPGVRLHAEPPSLVHLTVAGEPLPFPVPRGYVDAAKLSDGLQRWGESMGSPSGRLLAFWVDPAEVKANSAVDAEGLRRYFLLYAYRQTESRLLSDADFQGMKNAFIGEQGTFVRELRQQDPQTAETPLKEGDVRLVGVLFDEPHAFGYLIRTVFDFGGTDSIPMVQGMVYARHHNRHIGLRVYAVDDGPGAEQWVRQAALAWVRALPTDL